MKGPVALRQPCSSQQGACHTLSPIPVLKQSFLSACSEQWCLELKWAHLLCLSSLSTLSKIQGCGAWALLRGVLRWCIGCWLKGEAQAPFQGSVPPVVRQTAQTNLCWGTAGDRIGGGKGESSSQSRKKTERLEYKTDYNAAMREMAEVSSQEIREGFNGRGGIWLDLISPGLSYS